VVSFHESFPQGLRYYGKEKVLMIV